MFMDRAVRKKSSKSPRGSLIWKAIAEPLLAVPLMIALVTAILGILLQGYFQLSAVVLLTLTTVLVTSLFFAVGLRRHIGWQRLLAILTICILAAALSQLESSAKRPDTLGLQASMQWQPVVFEGVVRDPLRYRPQLPRLAAAVTTPVASSPVVDGSEVEQPQWTTLIPLEVTSIVDGPTRRDVAGYATLAVEGMLENYLPGDPIRAAGRMALIGPPRNPGEPDYQEMMQRRGELVRLRCDDAEAIELIEGFSYRWIWKRSLAYLGRLGRQRLAAHLAEPQCSLASALLLGQREQVSNQTNEELLATGTIHLLSISGLHVEMIAISLLMFGTLIRVPRPFALWGTAVLVLIYAMITGSNPPVVRATVLVLAVLSGRWMGRPASVYNTLGLAGLSLLIYQPSLVYDLGTELSFLAVFCLVRLSRPMADTSRDAAKESTSTKGAEPEELNQRTSRLYSIAAWLRQRVVPWLVSLSSMNVGVWLATAPLVLYHFHIVSPIALLLNVLLWLPVLVTMLAGLALMVLGWIPYLGHLLGKLCEVSIGTIEMLVHWGYQLRGGHVWMPAPSWNWLVIAYVFIGLSLALLWQRQSARLTAALLLIMWLIVGCADGLWGKAGIWREMKVAQWLLPTSDEGELRVQILDVGHGSAVVIRLPDGSAWLYDAGRLGDQQQVYKMISQALWELRIARLDGVILSHADSDHYSGMEGIVRRFMVDRFVAGPRQWEHSSPAIQSLHRLLQHREIELVTWQRGSWQQLGGATFRVLHPEPDERTGSDNSRSLCMVVEYAGRKVLLPGDIESPGMQQITLQTSPSCDVVMAPHHGSLAGTPREFLQWCGAQYVLISGSDRADQPAVHAVYGAEGRKVFITARQQAFDLRIDASGQLDLWHWLIDGWKPLSLRESSE
jgi:competence protein ComEC